MGRGKPSPAITMLNTIEARGTLLDHLSSSGTGGQWQFLLTVSPHSNVEIAVMSESSQDQSSPGKPARRSRYRGKNPRNFADKYKELAPEKYADDVAKILASGKTPAGSHRPIMIQEILKCLAPQPGETVVDCTLGFGGHARELLKAIQPDGKLIGLDVDPVELPKTEQRLRAAGIPENSLVVRQSNFAGLPKVLGVETSAGADVILADLGVSSMQIDNPARGFTFKLDGPLDMRMNPSRGPSAADLLSKWTATELGQALTEHADEPHATFLAHQICVAQQLSPLRTTQALATVVRQAYGQLAIGRMELAEAAVRRVFQTLRIAVNDELGALDNLLRQLPHCLRPWGRVAILSFHSGEDRRVKHHFKEGLRSGVYCHISDEITQATIAERRENPRSASAKLRHAIRSDVV